MTIVEKQLSEHPIVYVTRDIDRALGLDIDTPGYYIISNSTPFAKQLAAQKKRTQIVLIESDEPLDTRQLLEHAQAKSILDKKSVVVFKNTKKIERICSENGWQLLNPSAELANTVEEKISQVSWLGDLTKYLPKHKITTCEKLSWDGRPYIVQFNRAHTGEGTLLIESQKQIDEVKEKFPQRDVRVTAYIAGPIFTSNNVVTKNETLVGNISYQITGLQPYTKNPFATVGNDWGVVKKLLNEKQQEQFRKIAIDVGNKLRTDGWKGLFGIDVVLDEKTGKLYLIEINARQPQSATYESALQREASKIHEENTTFELHIFALFEQESQKHSLISINDGAQIIDRKTGQWTRSKTAIMKNHNHLTENLKSEVRSPKSVEGWKTLTPEATKVVDDYLNLPLAGKSVQCPYLNNRRAKIRGGLRVMIGKGTPKEISEEAELIALKQKIKLTDLDEDALKKFLVDNGLGIECSGFVYHTLDAELQARGKGSLAQHLRFPKIKNPIRKLLTRMRTAENTDVTIFADDINSVEIPVSEIAPGDFVTYKGSKEFGNHIILIQGIEFENGKPAKIFYTHSNEIPEDGKYGHGIRQGSFVITDVNKKVAQQQWPKDDKSISHYLENRELRRLRVLNEATV